MFSSKSLMEPGLTFRFLIYFEFIFLFGVRECSNFILLHVAVQLSQHHLLKRLFPTLYSCLLCWRLIDCRCVDLFLGSLFCSIDPYVCFCTNTTLFWLLYAFCFKPGPDHFFLKMLLDIVFLFLSRMVSFLTIIFYFSGVLCNSYQITSIHGDSWRWL